MTDEQKVMEKIDYADAREKLARMRLLLVGLTGGPFPDHLLLSEGEIKLNMIRGSAIPEADLRTIPSVDPTQDLINRCAAGQALIEIKVLRDQVQSKILGAYYDSKTKNIKKRWEMVEYEACVMYELADTIRCEDRRHKERNQPINWLKVNELLRDKSIPHGYAVILG